MGSDIQLNARVTKLKDNDDKDLCMSSNSLKLSYNNKGQIISLLLLK